MFDLKLRYDDRYRFTKLDATVSYGTFQQAEALLNESPYKEEFWSGNYPVTKYASFEQNSIDFDNPREFFNNFYYGDVADFYDELSKGLTFADQSTNGIFIDGSCYAEITFDNIHTFNGLSFGVDKYCIFMISAYDANGNEVDLTGDTTKRYIGSTEGGNVIVPVVLHDVKTVRIEITRTNPNSFITISSIAFGLQKWYKRNNILNIEFNHSSDLSGRSIPVSTLNFKIKTGEQEFFKKNKSLEVYINDKLYARFYVNSFISKIDKSTTVECQNILGMLDNKRFSGRTISTGFDPVLVTTELDKLFNSPIYGHNISYKLDGTVPRIRGTVERGYWRNALIQYTLGCARCLTDNLKGVINFRKINEKISNSTVVELSQIINIDTDITTESTVNSVQITARSYKKGLNKDSVDIYDDADEEKIRNSKITVINDKAMNSFYNAYYIIVGINQDDKRVAFTPEEQEAASYYYRFKIPNSIPKDCAVVVTGVPFREIKTSVSVTDDTLSGESQLTTEYINDLTMFAVKNISGETTTSLNSNVTYLCRVLLNYYQSQRIKLKMRVTDYETIKVGEFLNVSGYGYKSGFTFNGQIEQMTTNFDGLAEVELIGRWEK